MNNNTEMRLLILIKFILGIIKFYRFNIFVIYRFIKWNFLSRNIRRFNGAYFYPYPNLSIKLSHNSIIELYGNLHIGVPITKGSKTHSRLVMQENSRLTVNKKCDILEGCDIQIYKNGILTIDNFHSNIDLEILCGNQIRLIGEVTTGRHVRLKDYNGHFVSYAKYPLSKAIIVEDHVWICSGSTLNPGSYVETGAVVADNSNVNGRVYAHTFVQGNPAEVIKKDISFKI